tara:strand:- start:714 stop:1562 length:849 start_codon:yes stop_codon:yes gene_type:complete
MKISIILPMFNHISTIEHTLTCILKQTYRNIEVIIIDDNSTDGCSEVAKKYSKKYSNFFYKKINTKLESKFYNGINVDAGTTACNEALKYIKGEFVWNFGDEVFLNNSLEIMVGYLKELKCEHLIVDAISVSEDLFPIIHQKKFDFDKYKKENKINFYNSEYLYTIASKQMGIIEKILPGISKKFSFNFRNNRILRKIFFGGFDPLPGTAGSSLIKSSHFKKIKWRNLNERIWPSFNGRGMDRDLNYRIIREFKNSFYIDLPLLTVNFDSNNDQKIIDRYFY